MIGIALVLRFPLVFLVLSGGAVELFDERDDRGE
jgi:hypothetical protein